MALHLKPRVLGLPIFLSCSSLERWRETGGMGSQGSEPSASLGLWPTSPALPQAQGHCPPKLWTLSLKGVSQGHTSYGYHAKETIVFHKF